MATVEGRALTIARSNVKQYMTANNITLDTSYLGYDVAFRSSAKTGYAVFNDAAKTVLFPNTSAHPVKADSTMSIGASIKNANNYVELQFGGTSVHHQLCSNANETKTGLTDAAITGSTSASEIRYKMNINSTFVIAVAQTVTLTLYFNRYSCFANAVGNGVSSVNVSNPNPYQGETTTFTATLKSGATWHGWYSDAACTNLVSTDAVYSVVPTADITLYAKAIKQEGPSGIYLKQNSIYTQANNIWKKENGLWIKSDKMVIDMTKKYRIIK